MAKSKTKTAFVWSFLEQGAAKFVTLLVQIVLARLLTPEAFGILAIVLVVTNVADSIAQSGLGSALIQSDKADDGSYTTAFWMSMLVAGALFLCIQIGAPLAEAFYSMDGLAMYLRVLSIIVILNAANSIQRSYLQRSLDFRSLFLSSFTAEILSGVIGIVAAFMGCGVWALIIQSISQSVFICIAMASRVPWRPSFTFRKNEAWSLFSYGWKIAFSGVLNTLYSGVSELIVGKACTAEGLGYYSQGRKYPMAVINVVTNSIQNVMFPALAEKKGNPDAFREAARKALRLGSLIMVPTTLFCAAAAEPLVSLLLTDKWLPCVPIFQMVCISHSVLMLTLINLRAYMALGKSDLYLKLQFVKVAIGAISICGTAVITQDIYLTAFATCVSTLFNTVVVDVVPAGRVYGYPLKQQLADLLPCCVASIIAFAVACLCSRFLEGMALMLVLQFVVFWILFCAAAYLLKVPGISDLRQMLGSFVNRKA